MARSSEGRKLINKLIAETTEFDRSEENFTICQNYVTSNLRFHRYLDVDSHKVDLTLDGLYKKFSIHSEIETGNFLKDNITQFLNLHEFERKDVAKTDTHYAVLAFLLDMSNCPTSKSYHPSPELKLEDREADDFDWYGYLTEDLEPLQSEFSDSTIDSEEDSSPELETEVVCSPPVNSEDISKQVETTTNSLRDNLVIRYWAGEQESSIHTSNDLAKNWIGHLKGFDSLEAAHNDTYMTEYQVVREVLWMLSGAASTYLFSFNDKTQTFDIKSGVNLTHTTKPALINTLSKLISVGTEIHQLRKFVSEYIGGQYPLLTSRTHQAFCVAVTEMINSIDQFTTQITKQIKAEVMSATVLSLIQKYKDRAQIIHVVHSVYKSAILPLLGCDHLMISSAATYLLTACNSAVNNASVQFTDTKIVLEITHVFMRTLVPYLTIIDQWLTDGNLNDPHSEFVIRKKETDCLDETFWDTAVEVTKLELDEVDSPTDAFTFSRSVPDILEGTLVKIATTGKSMELLSRLGKLNLALGIHERSLHSIFIEKLCTELSWGETPVPIDDEVDDSLPVQKERSTIIDSTVTELGAQRNANPLLLANLKALFASSKVLFGENELGHLTQLNTQNMMSISKALSLSLGSLIDDRYKQVSQCLLEVLRTECKMEHYLTLIRQVYLMEAGDLMYGFWWDLFDKIRHSEDWKDQLSLNISLQECIETSFAKDMYRFSLSISPVQRSEFLPIHMLEELNLHYEVDWPVDVVYNTECETDYNKIFQFLLQLKLAKYSVDHLSFDELLKVPVVVEEDVKPETRSKEETHQLEQRIYLLRMQLLHFINGFNDYVMTTILHSSKLNFESKLRSASDLETIIQSHRAYLNQIYDRCFLHENNTVLHDCLLRIFNAAFVFQGLWDGGLTLITAGDIDGVHTELHRCLQILRSLVTALTKSGSLQHLESLSQALQITAMDS